MTDREARYATLEDAPLPRVSTDYESPTNTLAYEVPVSTLQKVGMYMYTCICEIGNVYNT